MSKSVSAKQLANKKKSQVQKKEPFLMERKEAQGKQAKISFLLSFMLPVLVMFVGYVINDIYPFGDQSILCSDLYNQYLPFFADLRDTLKNNGSLLYSWNLGLGSNFLALYAYYLASPFNWLLIFVPFQYLIEFMTILIMIKVGLCGLSFSYYLSEHFGKRDYSITLFSLFYALSGFIGAYNWDIMWLDVIALVPLVLLGVERLVKEKKPFTYCITLALSILFNYYISMILCIFLVMYFFAQVALLPKEKCKIKYIWQVGIRFAFFSILAAALAAVLLFPVAHALSSTKYASATFPQSWDLYFYPWEAFGRHFMNVDTEIGHDHWPNLYCGVAVFFLLPLYYMCKKITVKEKVVNSILIAIFFAAFCINKFNFIWHGMNYPNCLPCRQSFLYNFIIIVIYYQVYLKSREEHWGKYLVSVLVAASFVTWVIVGMDSSEYVDHSHEWTVVMLTLEVLVFWLYQKCKAKNVYALIGFLLVLIELTVNMTYSGILTSNRQNYVANRDSYVELVQEANELEDNDFYRIEMRERKTKNDSMYIGFHSATMFSSTTPEQLQKFYYEMGISSSKVFYWDTTGTPLLNAMLGVRYLFSEKDSLSNPFYQLVDTKGKISLYRNTYTLPLGYMVDSTLEDRWDFTEGTPIDSLNNLAYELGADIPMLLEMDEVLNEDGQTYYEVMEDGYYYVYVANKNVDEIRMDTEYMDDSTDTRTFKQVQNDYLLDAGYCEKGTILTFLPKEKGEEDANLDLRIYQVYEPSVKTACETLQKQTMQVTSYTDTKLEGTIDVTEAGKLVMSIPYEDGWTMYVDGVETEVELFADTFMAVTLPEGTHTITLKFYPKGLRAGIIVSLCAIAVLFMLIHFKGRIERLALEVEEKEELERVEEEAKKPIEKEEEQEVEMIRQALEEDKKN